MKEVLKKFRYNQITDKTLALMISKSSKTNIKMTNSLEWSSTHNESIMLRAET